ncbi:hypothetical protein [Lysobacter sp. cf310]|uniref:hypothetical protein n=1 Tax=Lysobacter sp. cf310 TaxID=1761790 RepID=UPI0008EACCBC|nr:hypothetical protein [Lysobacter sp. cf310]SFK69914.1 hypothetical protein SAMN04487938_1661 [Lysobacter sp. cf310]
MNKLKPRLLASLLLSALSLPALALEPCNPCNPVDPPKVYAVGTAYTPNWQAAMWVDGVRTDLPPLVNAYNTGAKEANDVVVVDNFMTGEPDIYVAGTANITTNNAAAADSSAMVWKNGEIHSQIPSISSTYVNQFAGAKGLFIDNGNIYTAGYTDAKFSSIAGPQPNFADMKPVYWKNGQMTLLPINPSAYRGMGTRMTVRNGNTYVIGTHAFTLEGHPATPGVFGSGALWVNGTEVQYTPMPYPETVTTTTTQLYVGGALAPYANETVYRAGYIYRALSLGSVSAGTGSPGIFYGVILGKAGMTSRVTDMQIVGTRIYAVGWELRPSGKYVAKLWINQSGVDLSEESESAIATSVFVHGNDVYVGGSTNNILNQYAKAVIWKNGAMTSINGTALGSHITSIYVK